MRRIAVVVAIACAVATPVAAESIVQFDTCIGSCLGSSSGLITFRPSGGSVTVTIFGKPFGNNAIGFNIAGSKPGSRLGIFLKDSTRSSAPVTR